MVKIKFVVSLVLAGLVIISGIGLAQQEQTGVEPVLEKKLPNEGLVQAEIDRIDRRPATLIVAAHNSVSKMAADYVCDGSEDEKEIQEALNKSGRGKVVLLEGNYVVSNTISLIPGGVLEGMGRSNTSISLAPKANCNILNIASDSSVRNLTLYGNKDNQTKATHGIGALETERVGVVWLESLEIHDFKGNGINLPKAQELRIIHCRLHQNDDYAMKLGRIPDGSACGITFLDNSMEFNLGGIYMEGVDVWENFIVGGWIGSNKRHGVYIANARGTIIIQRVDFTGNGLEKGEWADVYCNSVPEIIINGCIFQRYADPGQANGVYIKTSNYGTIAHSTFQDYRRGAIVLDKTSYFQIGGNIIRDSCQEANNTYDTILLTNESTHNIIQGNIITETAANKARYGIRENTAGDDYNLITDNIITGAVTSGVSTQGTNTKIRDNLYGK